MDEYLTKILRQKMEDKGWEHPLEKSPVENPNGWSGGGLIQTGGHIYCRVWTTQDETNVEQDTYFEVIYNSDFNSVGLNRYKYSPSDDDWHFDEHLKSITPEEETDSSCSEAALKLMKPVNGNSEN